MRALDQPSSRGTVAMLSATDQVWEEADLLDGVADLAPELRRVALADAPAVEQDVPFGDVDHAVDHPHGGGLAAARWAHEHADLARRDGEREVVHSRLVLARIALGGIPELQRRGSRTRGRPLRWAGSEEFTGGRSDRERPGCYPGGAPGSAALLEALMSPSASRASSRRRSSRSSRTSASPSLGLASAVSSSAAASVCLAARRSSSAARGPVCRAGRAPFAWPSASGSIRWRSGSGKAAASARTANA